MGNNRPSQIFPKYLAPVMTIENGAGHVSLLRWGMPTPMPPLMAGEKPKRQGFLTHVRNTRSGHWRPWLQSAEVTFGPHRGGRCIVPGRAFAEPDRTTSKPMINRWFARRDGKPFFFAGLWREWVGDVGTIKEPNVGTHRLYAFLTTEPNGIVAPMLPGEPQAA